jgi:hypothetical protein
MALANVQTFARDKLTIMAALQQINKVAHQAPLTQNLASLGRKWLIGRNSCTLWQKWSSLAIVILKQLSIQTWGQA